ncbi:hypothetical protein B2J88_51255 [Rhodococcus sp. SRB_17]|nr:hypothetical protein [Rhodococcus sp. SRB_17]
MRYSLAHTDREGLPMTTPRTRPAKSESTGAEGQWATGHREPLNVNERAKQDDDGPNVRKTWVQPAAYEDLT